MTADLSIAGAHTAFGAGLLLGTASLLSIGPNNLMLVREGLRRGHVATLATTVWSSYCLLCLLAFLLADRIGAMPSGLHLALSWLGLAALAAFALQSLRAATGRVAVPVLGTRRIESRAACVRRGMLVVWCNPLTYLELLLVPAALCASFAAAPARFAFIGAVTLMGALCCYGYAYGGGVLGALVRREGALRAFDAASGLLLASAAVVMSLRLAQGGL